MLLITFSAFLGLAQGLVRDINSKIKYNATFESAIKIFKNIEVEERKCFSCGRNISNQKKGSKFCSEKVYGKEAKRCRNVDSNPRNNFKQREKRIKNGGLLFEIDSYLISNFVH